MIIKNLVVILVCVLLSSSALACFMPAHGPEYDSLIKITKLNRKNEYQIEVPQKVGKLDFGVSITLGYSNVYPHNENMRLQEHASLLAGKKKNGNITATFFVKRISGKKPYINVFWIPEAGGLCGASASSNFLNTQN